MTITVALALVLPPEPVHASVYDVLEVGEIDCVPLVAFVPVQSPEAVHEVALVEDHVSTEDWPEVTEVGFAERATVGGETVTVTVAFAFAVPPVPVQDTE